MVGINSVELQGFLRFPQTSETRNGYTKFTGRVAIPFSYVDKQTGETKEGSKMYKLAAWGDTAQVLGSIEEGTLVRVQGQLSERSYEGNCKSCGGKETKYWSEVLVDTVVVV